MLVSFADYAFPIRSDEDFDVQYLYDNVDTLDYYQLTVLAQLFFSGDVDEIGLQADLKKAQELAERAWQVSGKSYSEPLVLLGILEAVGVSGDRDYLLAKDFFEKALEFGNAMAATNLGALHLHDVLPESSPEKAGELFNKAYNLNPNDPVICYNLGLALLNGAGLEQDKERAIILFEKASLAGHLNSKAQLAFIYSNERSDDQQNRKAAVLFKELSDAGNAYGMSGLGTAFLRGQGTVKNVFAGLELLKKASELGDPNAHFQLFLVYSGRYRLKQYVQYSLDLSLKYLSLAVKTKHPKAIWEYNRFCDKISSVFDNENVGRPTALINLPDNNDETQLFSTAEAKSVGEMFARARENRKLSQRAAARDSHIDPKNLRQIENGDTDPSLKTIRKIADGIGYDVEVRLTPKSNE